MSQALRRAATIELTEQLAAIEARRGVGTPPAWRADEYSADEVRMTAHALLPRIARRWPDLPHVQADRRQQLEAADIAWNLTHRKAPRKAVA